MSDLIKSKRFWAAIGGLAVVIVQQFVPSIPESAVLAAVGLISTWILGETFRPVSEPKE